MNKLAVVLITILALSLFSGCVFDKGEVWEETPTPTPPKEVGFSISTYARTTNIELLRAIIELDELYETEKGYLHITIADASLNAIVLYTHYNHDKRRFAAEIPYLDYWFKADFAKSDDHGLYYKQRSFILMEGYLHSDSVLLKFTLSNFHGISSIDTSIQGERYRIVIKDKYIPLNEIAYWLTKKDNYDEGHPNFLIGEQWERAQQSKDGKYDPHDEIVYHITGDSLTQDDGTMSIDLLWGKVANLKEEKFIDLSWEVRRSISDEMELYFDRILILLEKTGKIHSSTPDEYKKWFKGYIENNGKIAEFSTEDFPPRYTTWYTVIHDCDLPPFYGAGSVCFIIENVKAQFPYGVGHNEVYYCEDYTANDAVIAYKNIWYDGE